MNKEETMKELKDLLKPSFKWFGETLENGERDDVLVLDRSVLASKNYGLIVDLKAFLITALNNEWQRQFGEPMRWRVRRTYRYCDVYICDKCNEEFSAHIEQDAKFAYCPLCGQRLFPPEGGGNEKSNT